MGLHYSAYKEMRIRLKTMGPTFINTCILPILAVVVNIYEPPALSHQQPSPA